MTDVAKIYHVGLGDLCQHQQQPFFMLPSGTSETGRVVSTFRGPSLRPSDRHVCTAGASRRSSCSEKVMSAMLRSVPCLKANRTATTAVRSSAAIIKDKSKRKRSRVPTWQRNAASWEAVRLTKKNFGHFIFEYLSRLVAFDMAGVLDRFPLVVYDDIPESWLSFIELFGVPRDRIGRIPQVPAPRFAAVWIAACPNFLHDTYSFWDEGVWAMHHALRRNAHVDAHSGPKRIFIGRQNAQHRKLLNEEDIWSYLASRGFAYPNFADKSAQEQIRLIGSAEIVVVATGAGSVTELVPGNRTGC